MHTSPAAFELNAVLAVYLGEPGSGVGGSERVEAMVGTVAAPRAVALCQQITDSLSQVPAVLTGTWPVDRILDLACDIATAAFPALTHESLAVLRSHWAFNMR